MQHFFDVVLTEFIENTTKTVLTVYATDQELIKLLETLNATKGNSDSEFTAIAAE